MPSDIESLLADATQGMPEGQTGADQGQALISQYFPQSQPVRANPVDNLLQDAGVNVRAERRQQTSASILADARRYDAMEGDSTGYRVARDVLGVLPFGSPIRNFAEANQYTNSQQRIRDGNPESQDFDIVARYERHQEEEKAKNETTAGHLGQTALHLPGMAAEFMLGGRVLGAAGVSAEAPAFLSRAAWSSLPAAGATAGRLAAQTALIPSMYLEDAQRRNHEEGRDSLDPRGLAPAFGLGMMATAVLGSMGKVAEGVGGAGLRGELARGAIRTGTGILEQNAIDTVAHYAGLQTGYGSIQSLLRGEDDAQKKFWGQLLTFGAFSLMHVGQRERGPVEVAAEAMRETAKTGLSDRVVPAEAAPVFRDVGHMLDNPSNGRAEVAARAEAMPNGFPKKLTEAIAKSLPEAPKTAPAPAEVPAPVPKPPEAAPAAPRAPLQDVKDLAKSLGLSIKGSQGEIEGRISKVGGGQLLEALTKPAVTNTPNGEVTPVERRSDAARRKRVAEMTPEERARELLTSQIVDLPNRRAFDEGKESKVVAMSDADGLKALNDKFGYAAGDALLMAKAKALKEAGVDAYHEKGDEFLHRSEDAADLKTKLEKAREILRNTVIEFKAQDGTVKRFKGGDFSYGIGGDLTAAEGGLKVHKAEREARGERARGELRGIAEVTDVAVQRPTPENLHEAILTATTDPQAREAAKEFGGIDELQKISKEIPNDIAKLSKSSALSEASIRREIERGLHQEFAAPEVPGPVKGTQGRLEGARRNQGAPADSGENRGDKLNFLMKNVGAEAPSSDPMGLESRPVPQVLTQEVLSAVRRLKEAKGNPYLNPTVAEIAAATKAPLADVQAALVQLDKAGEVRLNPFTQGLGTLKPKELEAVIPYNRDPKFYVEPSTHPQAIAPEEVASVQKDAKAAGLSPEATEALIREADRKAEALAQDEIDKGPEVQSAEHRTADRGDLEGNDIPAGEHGGFDPEELGGYGQPLTEAERRAGGIAGGSGEPGGGRPERVTALANAQAEAEIAKAKGDLPALPVAEHVANQARSDAAQAELARDPSAGFRLVESLAKNPRPTTPHETAILLHHKTALMNEHERSMLQLIDAWKSGVDVIEAKRLEDLERELNGQVAQFYSVAKKVGTESGTAFQLRAQLMKEDFTLAGMMMRATAAKGEPLTPQEITQVRDLQARIMDLQGRLDAAQRSLTEGGQGIESPAYPEWNKGMVDVKDAQGEFNQQLQKYRNDRRTWFEKLSDLLVKIRVNMVISSPLTLGKIATASIQRIAIAPLEQAAGALWSKLPGLAKIAAMAPREGRGFDLATEKKAIVSSYSEGLKDAWRTIQTGQSELDVLHGDREQAPRTWLDWQFSLHAAAKDPAVRAEYTRSFLERIDNAARQGKDTTSPAALLEFSLQAYKDSQAAKFQQENWLVDAYKRFTDTLRKPTAPVASQVVGMGFRLLTPVVRIPTNLAFETAKYVFGTATGTAQALRAHWMTGLENLKPKEADAIMQQFKKGSLGLGALLLGAMNPTMFGGYYSPKREESDVKAGGVRIGNVDIPSWTQHNPLLQVFQIGATFRRAFDRGARTYEGRSAPGAAWEAAKGWLEEIPLVRETGQVAGLNSSNANTRGYHFGELAKSFAIPQFFQWLAGRMDTTTGNPITGEKVKRAPEGVMQHIREGIPVLRNDLPRRR